MTGNSITNGISSAGFNEALQKELGKIKDPEIHKLASALVGSITSSIVRGNNLSGTAIAINGTSWNYLKHEQYTLMIEQLKRAKTEQEREKIKAYWKKVDVDNERDLSNTINLICAKYMKDSADYYDPTKYIPAKHEIDSVVRSLHRVTFEGHSDIRVIEFYNRKPTNPIEDFEIYSNRRNNDLAKRKIEERGIMPNDPEYDNALIKEFLTQKEITDNFYATLGFDGFAGIISKISKITNINGANRDAERFVVGSDGSVYYTQSHYSEFSKIK